MKVRQVCKRCGWKSEVYEFKGSGDIPLCPMCQGDVIIIDVDGGEKVGEA